jgi:hypothetical protein
MITLAFLGRLPRLRQTLLVLFLWPTLVAAQQQLATLQGTITDQTGSVLPSVTVIATNVDTGIARTVSSNGSGVYRLPGLEPGRYRLTAALSGFAPYAREGIVLEVGASVGLSFVLEAGTVAEQIEVRGAAPLVQTERADISSVVERKRIEELPLVSRNPLALTALQPGVTGIPTRSDFLQPEQGLGINASGMRGGANSAYVDGMSINANPHAGTVLIVPNVEAVQEFQVITNNPSAEHGRNVGAAVNLVTRGGTNAFNGSVYQFYRNEALRAKNIFETTKPDFRRNNYGFSLGGPLRRDSMFFFGSYERLDEETASGALHTVETEQFRDFIVQTRPNSIAARLVREYAPRAYPTSNLRDLGSPAKGANVIGPPDGIPDVGTVSLAIPSPRAGAQVNGRFDRVFRGGSDQLRATYYLSNINTWFSDVRDVFDHPYPHRIQLFTAAYSRVMSNQTLNELAFGYVRMHGEADNPTPDVPTISITGLSGQAGFGALNWHPIGFTQNYFQVKDTLTATRGTHSIRAGGEARVTMQYQDFHHFERPTYSFSNILDFADDEPFSELRGVDPRTGLSRSTENRYLQTDFALFVQDNWKIRPNLTANLGLRYEVFTSPTLADRPFNALLLGPDGTRVEQVANARNGTADRLYETDWSNLAPRLGISWDPSGDAVMVLRGGGGVSYNRINNTVWTGEWQNPPHFAQASTSIFDPIPILYTLGPDFPENPALAAGLDDRGGIRGARISLTGLDPSVRTPYAYNWFAGVQRLLPWGFIADASYIGTAGRRLMRLDFGGGENFNRFSGDLLDGRLDRLNPSFGAISLNESNITSRYDGMTLQLRRRYGSGFAFQAAYTLGKATDTAGVSVDLRRPDLERGPAGHDVRHRLAVNQVLEIPVPSGNVFVKHVLGGWQFSSITVWQTGSPFTVFTSAPYPNGDYNADGQNDDRPNTPSFGTRLSSPSEDEWLAGVFRAADFPRPAAGGIGDLPRNSHYGPGYLNTDLAVAKTVRVPALARNAAMQIRIETYNLFNTVNLNNPTNNLTSALFGRVTSARPSREVQLGLRFTF